MLLLLRRSVCAKPFKARFAADVSVILKRILLGRLGVRGYVVIRL